MEDMSDQKVIQIIGLVTGAASVFDSEFVVEYDASRPDSTGNDSTCHLVTTPNLADATRYPAAEAFELWRSVDQRNPVRGDGKPNRPLTAFHVAFLDGDLVQPWAP